jgi:hypothetical protein
MKPEQAENQYSPAETKRRMENALRRALNTPPQPHKDMVGQGKRESEPGKSRVKRSDR